jgi:hypothetical protein
MVLIIYKYFLEAFMPYTFISGATGGLGKAFAVACAMRGENLFLTSTKQDKLALLAESLTHAYKIDVKYAVCDMAIDTERNDLIIYLKQDGFTFNKLINTVGFDHEGEFLTLNNDIIRNLIRVNVESVIDITYSILNLRTSQKFTIITVSSLAGEFPMPYKALYSSSKRMLTNFFRAFAYEVKDQNISITLLTPATIPTNPQWTKNIEAVGFSSLLSVKNVGIIAYKTLLKADKGQAVYIPGFINKLADFFGKLIPVRFMNKIIYNRCKNISEKSK